MPNRPIDPLHGSGLLPVEISDTAGVPPGGFLEAEGLSAEVLTNRQLAWRRFRRHKAAMASLVIFGIIVLLTLLAPVVAPVGFEEQFITRSLEPPSRDFWFGTDRLGRDVLTRVLYGGRVSILVGIGVALASAMIGTVVGAIAGFFGGRIDTILMRFTDAMLALPALIFLIVVGRILGTSVFNIVLVLTLIFWMPLARIVRGQFLSLKEKEFVEAARALGAKSGRIIFRHILPNTIGPITVTVTLLVAGAILSEATLSFLGFGIQLPTPSWGNMIADARGQLTTSPWMLWFPGLALIITVICVNFLGDGLRDALDPTQRKSS
ncbi:MAG: ABC transporter permease [Acidimicrobiia bacterium]|nr:ABC transporter permease [Acidimicrobiia bacterium]